MALSTAFLQHIAIQIESATGSKHRINYAKQVNGGDINFAYRVYTDTESFFIKVNSANEYPDIFSLEAKGLKSLGEVAPPVLGTGTYENLGYLLLPWISSGNNDNKAQENLGRRLADLHRKHNLSFGLNYNNYIGRLSQLNTPKQNWSEFYIQNRLNYQLLIAEKNKLADAILFKKFQLLFNKLDQLFPVEPAALLHGDLWSGNYIIATDSVPILIDPSIYYGHREMDIAMSALFGGFETAFYNAYNESFPLQAGWQERLPLWQLYPLLVHLNMFGTSYLPSVHTALDKFIS